MVGDGTENDLVVCGVGVVDGAFLWLGVYLLYIQTWKPNDTPANRSH